MGFRNAVDCRIIPEHIENISNIEAVETSMRRNPIGLRNPLRNPSSRPFRKRRRSQVYLSQNAIDLRELAVLLFLFKGCEDVANRGIILFEIKQPSKLFDQIRKHVTKRSYGVYRDWLV